MRYQQVLEFWFEELSPADWFRGGERLDSRIAFEFSDIHAAATAGELYSWRHCAAGRLAEVMVLDQFSRHLYRGHWRAFAQDGQALVLAQEALRMGLDRELEDDARAFLYLPYMHSESLAIQRAGIYLYTSLGREENLRFAERHCEVIERFGRFPHRNAALGRESTEEERLFLEQPGSSF
jgi:uncharacterized protein (DUF924 family)